VDAALKLGAFDLDIEFEKDEGVTALFGRSGSGKSTTINLIAGLVRPDRGRIVLDGRTLVDTETGIFVPKHRRLRRGRRVRKINPSCGKWARPGRIKRICNPLAPTLDPGRWLRSSRRGGRAMRYLSDRYRPELHYMRGPGPKWLEKHAGQSGAIVVPSEGHHESVTLGRRIELMLRHWLPNRWRIGHRATQEIQWADRLGPWSV